MYPAEQIAVDTWERLKHSRDLQVRLGEETLTDLLALDFTRSMKCRVKLLQCSKAQESEKGTDLEIRIHVGGDQAYVLAVQAKKLGRTGRYDHLNAKAKRSGCNQIDILECYSKGVSAIPLYLLYNYVNQNEIQQYWHCCQCRDSRQLGCTLVPSWNIRRAISMRGHRTFNSIHSSCAALPWRCLFDCPEGRHRRLLPAVHRSLSVYSQETERTDTESNSRFETSDQPNDYRRYNWVRFQPVDGGWPDWLWSRKEETFSVEDAEELYRGFLTHERGNASKQIAPTVELPRYVILVSEAT